MHGRRRFARRFTMELTLCAALHVCRARDSGSSEKMPTLVLTGHTNRVSDASRSGRLLANGQHVVVT